MEKSMTQRHKGSFVGGHFYDEELAVFEAVMDYLESITGERNQAATLRYIVRNFPISALPAGKEYAPMTEAA